MVISSPDFRYVGGVRPRPTPAGCGASLAFVHIRLIGPLRRLVVVTYCARCQDVTWHECLPLRHGLEEIGDAEDQVIGSGVLA